MSPTKFFGSDVYTHYTATYAWNSNQMAHAMMGLAGTMLFVHAAPRLGLEVWYGALFFVIPFLKDTADYWVDRSNTGGVFGETAAHRRELLVDGVTDNLFWSVGMVLALFMALSRDGTPWYLYIVFVAAVLLIVAAVCCVGRLFNAQKRRYDSSGLPYYFRLPCYDGNLVAAWVIDSKASRDATSPVEEVERFVYRHDCRAQHLILVGPPRSSKTTLAAAIGSGLIVRGQTVRYMSKMQLIEEFNISGERSASQPAHPCDAGILITDDLDEPTGLDPILPALACKSTVWVVTSPRSGKAEDWTDLLGRGLRGRLVAVRLDTKSCRHRNNCRSPRSLAIALSSASLLVSAIAGVGSIILIVLPIDLFANQLLR